jgi:hypothetical protein
MFAIEAMIPAAVSIGMFTDDLKILHPSLDKIGFGFQGLISALMTHAA